MFCHRAFARSWLTTQNEGYFIIHLASIQNRHIPYPAKAILEVKVANFIFGREIIRYH